jgi:hypothetical protein
VNDVRPPDINTPDDYHNMTVQRSTENGQQKTENVPSWSSESSNGSLVVALCSWTRYKDGRGHPIALTWAGVEEIGGLSGTKALWPWFESLADDERYELVVDAVKPSDINTRDDYDELVSG